MNERINRAWQCYMRTWRWFIWKSPIARAWDLLAHSRATPCIFILIGLLMFALALTACSGGGDSGGSGLPEPPADDATPAELETFMDEYTAWLEDCGDLNRCAELVENDPRYNKGLETP
jgi:hypothetical protein